MNEDDDSTQDTIAMQLRRIEERLIDIHERVVRLEYRMETSGAFKDKDDHRDAELRFALEHRFDPSILESPAEEITLAFYQRVVDWMVVNEDRDDVSFTRLAAEMAGPGESSKTHRAELTILIQYFALTHQWTSMLIDLTSDSHPRNLKRWLVHPYESAESGI